MKLLIKICSKCGFVGDEILFAKDRNVCKVCMALYMREFCKNNKPKLKEQKKEYYINNIEKIKERNKVWRENNKDKIKEHSNLLKLYTFEEYETYVNNFERVMTDPHSVNGGNYNVVLINKLYAIRSRTKQFDLPPVDVDLEYLHEIYPIDGFCPITGIKMIKSGNNNPNSPTTDRIIPDKGYVKGNIVWMSMKANSIKWNNTLQQLKDNLTFWKNQLGVK